MLRFIIRRLLQAIPTLFVLSILVFAWLRVLPGGPAGALLGDKATPQKLADLNHLLGLDQSIFVQYFKFLGRVVTGNFGNSLITGDTVLAEIGRAFPATIELAVFALVLAIVFGIPLGYLAARHHGRLLDNATVLTTLVGVAVPVFFFGVLLKYVFAQKLGILPPSGRQDVTIDATHITGFFVLDGLLTGELDAAWDAIKHLILPAIALASIPFAVIVRITRASVLDVQEEDFVRTAESKGLTTPVIRRRHILRNALLPVSTTIGLQTGLLLAGAVLTEKVFNLPGLGYLLAQGIERRDYPRLQALLLRRKTERIDDLAAAGGTSLAADAFRRMSRSPIAIIGAVITVLFVLLAILSPFLAPKNPYIPYDELKNSLRPDSIPGPMPGFLLGSDQNGYDFFSRLLVGSQQTLIVGVGATVIGVAIGMVIGGLAGALGGWVDTLLMRFTDILLAVPSLLLAISIAALFAHGSQWTVIIAVAVVSVPVFARLLRGAMLAQRSSDHVLAATALGVRRSTVVFRHMLPNSISPVIVQATLTLATSIIDAAALSFLGLGDSDPSRAEWGLMLGNSQGLLDVKPELAFYPAIAIIVVALGFTLLGESLREALDPKNRR